MEAGLETDGRAPVRLLQYGAGKAVAVTDEVCNEGVIWTGVNTLGAFDLLNIALVHHRDAVGDGQCLLLIVGDVYGSDADVLLDFADRLAHLDAQLCVEVGERLVHEQHLRLHDDGARQRHALLLPAGELVRIAVPVLRDLYRLHDRFHAALDLVLRELFVFETVLDVAIDGHVRKDGIVLEHHAEIALMNGDVVDDRIIKRDGAVFDRVETGDHAQKRRFAAAGRSEQREQLAAPDICGEVVYDDIVVILLHYVFNMNRYCHCLSLHV